MLYLCTQVLRKGARVVEEARLESVYTSKAYHGFESRPFRKYVLSWNLKGNAQVLLLRFFFFRRAGRGRSILPPFRFLRGVWAAFKTCLLWEKPFPNSDSGAAE